MPVVLSVALFGAAGCVARFIVTGWFARSLGASFPYGTFAVNVAGSFLIGLVMDLATRHHAVTPELRVAVVAGFLGGFTTFSAFSYETFELMEHGQPLLALANGAGSVLVCLLATWGGILAARALHG